MKLCGAVVENVGRLDNKLGKWSNGNNENNNCFGLKSLLQNKL